jgi:hypothetical protein
MRPRPDEALINRPNLKSFCAIVTALLGAAQLVSANLIVNPGFETGDFTGWPTTLATSGSNLFVVPVNSHSGTYAVSFGASSGDLDAISQSLATTPGTLYQIRFWLKLININNEFRITFGGVTLLNLVDTDTGPFGYEHYKQFTLTGFATGSSTILEFAARNPPNFLLSR